MREVTTAVWHRHSQPGVRAGSIRAILGYKPEHTTAFTKLMFVAFSAHNTLATRLEGRAPSAIPHFDHTETLGATKKHIRNENLARKPSHYHKRKIHTLAFQDSHTSNRNRMNSALTQHYCVIKQFAQVHPNP